MQGGSVASEGGVNRWVRRASLRAFSVLRERELAPLYERVIADTIELLEASVVHRLPIHPTPDGAPAVDPAGAALPETARRMEAALLPRALAAEKSLVSTHPQLDATLTPLAAECAKEGITTHLLLARALGETHAAFGVHWIGRARPSYERRVGFYYYWDNVGIAIATARERLLALVDRRTGLANEVAFDVELARHRATVPLSVLVLDFDGLREANDRFGYELGGDVLISAVGRALSGLVRPPEFAARLHTAGDEFAVLIPGAGESVARTRAREIEAALEEIEVPDSHRAVYHGASAGVATRQRDETPNQTIGRAVAAMRKRKRRRRDGAA